MLTLRSIDSRCCYQRETPPFIQEFDRRVGLSIGHLDPVVDNLGSTRQDVGSRVVSGTLDDIGHPVVCSANRYIGADDDAFFLLRESRTSQQCPKITHKIEYNHNIPGIMSLLQCIGCGDRPTSPSTSNKYIRHSG